MPGSGPLVSRANRPTSAVSGAGDGVQGLRPLRVLLKKRVFESRQLPLLGLECFPIGRSPPNL